MEAYSISESIEFLGIGVFHLKLVLNVLLLWFSEAIEITTVSILPGILECEWKLSTFQQTFLSVVLYSGTIFGCSFLGKIIDKYGRRKPMTLAIFFNIFFCSLMAISPNYIFLIIWRFFSGMCLGSYFHSLTLLIEFTPISTRSYIVAILTIPYALGASYGYVLAGLLIINTNWRLWLFISSLPYIFSCITLYKSPESIRYLSLRGEKEKILAIINKAAKDNNVVLPSKEFIFEKIESRGQLKDLWMRPYKSRLIRNCLLGFVTYYSYTFLYLIQPLLEDKKLETNGLACLINGCRPNKFSFYLNLVKSSAMEILATPCALFFFYITGRRNTLTLNSILAAISFLPVAFNSQFIPLYLCIGSSRVFTSTLITTNAIYSAELFPTPIRGLAIGISSSILKIGCIFASFLSQLLFAYNKNAALWTYVLLTITVPGIIWGLPETKNQQLSDTFSKEENNEGKNFRRNSSN